MIIASPPKLQFGPCGTKEEKSKTAMNLLFWGNHLNFEEDQPKLTDH